VKLVHVVGFIIKKFVTMHGHTNVKITSVLCNINITHTLFLVLWPTCLVACTVINHYFLKQCHFIVSLKEFMYRNFLNLLTVCG
jgi:hypothetical protein